jgi:hypothetical protein
MFGRHMHLGSKPHHIIGAMARFPDADTQIEA